MGQYYKPCNIDKKECLYSHDYDNGLKLMEHSYAGNDFVNAVVILLAGEWKNNRIVWAGDYADPEPNTENEDYEEGRNFFQMDYPELKNLQTDDFSYKYILNHDKKEFVEIPDASAQDDWPNWNLHPLPLLTCEGNGRGGGDYGGYDKDGLIGLWARDHLEAVHENATDYKEIEFNLKED